MAKVPKIIKEPFDNWHLPATITVNNFKYKSLSNWAFNISVGCSHACRFCYVPSAATNKQAPELKQYQISNPDEQWGDYSLLRPWDENKFLASLKSAENTPAMKLKKDGNRAIIFCSTTDPYQVFHGSTPEKTKLLNDAALSMVEKALVAIRDKSTLNVRILTRSPLAKKHFDLFKTFGNRLVFGMSLPTLDDRLARVYEPKAPSPSLRLKTLQEAKEAGLHVFVAMAPTYPECDETDLRKTLAANLSNGLLSVVQTTPTNLTWSVTGTNLNLSWPQGYTGWQLFMQTNNLGSGLSLDTNDWFAVPASQTTNQVTLPLDPALPAGFYRLIFP